MLQYIIDHGTASLVTISKPLLPSILKHAPLRTMSSSNTVYLTAGADRGLGLGLLKALLKRPNTTIIGQSDGISSAKQ